MDKGWPNDIVGIAPGDQNVERTAQARQRRQTYIDYTLKGLRPRYLQRRAQEYLMDHPNATWNDFSTHLVNKDVSYQVSTSFLNDEEQNKAQMASLGQELKNLRIELKEHRVTLQKATRDLLNLIRREDRTLQGFVGTVKPMDALQAFVERRYEMKSSRSCRMKLQQRKRLHSPKITTRDEDLPTDLKIGLDEMTIMGL